MNVERSYTLSQGRNFLKLFGARKVSTLAQMFKSNPLDF
jgi:hypothetical protein